MKGTLFKNKLASSLFVLTVGSILMIGVFMAMVYFYYIVLRFDDPIAKTRVALNVAIIAFSYLVLGLLAYKLYRAKLSDEIKASVLPALLTANIELVMNTILTTDLPIPLFYLDGLVIFGLLIWMAIKKVSYPYFVGAFCTLFWHLGFIFMMGGFG